MHFCAGVIQRGNAEEYVVLGLVVVLLFHLAGVHQAAVGVQDRLGKTGGSRGEVDGCIILICQRHAVHIDGGSAQQKVGIFKLMSIFLADGVQNFFCFVYNFRSDSVSVN